MPLEKNETSCYCCDAPATSREHVPPLCLFPEAKDLPGSNYRKDLITVPSCDRHNSRKSHDDEFLMICMAGLVNNNQVGLDLARSKVLRALDRKPEFFSKAVIQNIQRNIISTASGKVMPVLYGNADDKRLERCFEQILLGIWYHEHGYRFKGALGMRLCFFQYTDQNESTLTQYLLDRVAADQGLLELKGNNPDIFTYQFCSPDRFGSIVLKLTLYGGSEVIASFLPEGLPEPFDQGAEDLRQGKETTLKLGNRIYKFD